MQKPTPVVLNLIIINVLMFAVQNLVTAFDVTDWGALHYFKSDDFKPHQLITHMFLHGGMSHIFFNLFTLFMFGTMLENYIGSKRFLVFYMICGLCAGLLTQLSIPYSAEMFANALVMVTALLLPGCQCMATSTAFNNPALTKYTFPLPQSPLSFTFVEIKVP